MHVTREELKDLGIQFLNIVHEFDHGEIYVSQPFTSNGTWYRNDGFRSARSGELTRNGPIRCYDQADTSPSAKKYAPDCHFCWLNHGHTELLHQYTLLQHEEAVRNHARRQQTA